jgi:hypothetical protein
MSETVVPALDALWHVRAPARERQRPWTVWAEDDIGVGVGEVVVSFEHIRIIQPEVESARRAARKRAVWGELESGDFDANAKFVRDEVAHGGRDFACAFEHDQATGSGDFEVYHLTGRRIGRVLQRDR